MKVGAGLSVNAEKVLLFYRAVFIKRGHLSFNVTKYLFTNA